MNQLIDGAVTFVNTRGDHAWVSGILLGAGLIPFTNDFNSLLQMVYFLVLIPPAAYHCYLWFTKTAYPIVSSWFNKKEKT